MAARKLKFQMGMDLKAPTPEPPQPFTCDRCGITASYGYDVKLRLGQRGRWFCREHRPEKSP